MKKIFIFLILIFEFSVCLFASDITDSLLDQSIDEFSKKNYSEALVLIDEVLELEPDNSTALMYKKTIEDVISIDEEEVKQNTNDINETSDQELTQVIDSTNPTVKDVQSTPEIISLSTIIAKAAENDLVLTSGFKLDLGLPVVELELSSYSLNQDITALNFNSEMVSEIFDINNYSLKLSIGARYRPFHNLGVNGGFFDISIGARNFVENDNQVVPFIEFDTEIYLLTLLGDNLIFDNLWVGGSGSIFNFDGEFVDNYSLEFKTGLRIGYVDIGWIYANDITNNTYTGVVLGLNF